MTATAEDKLLDEGYAFTGFGSKNKTEAKEEATRLRKNGFYARVLSQVYTRRVGSCIFYNVYSKERKPKSRQQ